VPKSAHFVDFSMILGTKEHQIDHPGQLTVIERLIGIVAPHAKPPGRARSGGDEGLTEQDRASHIIAAFRRRDS